MLSESKILEIARSVRADAWVDFASKGALSVGFADNTAPLQYNVDVAKVAEALKSAGFKVKTRTADDQYECTIIKVLP